MKIRIKYFEGATKLKKISKGNWIDVYACKDIFDRFCRPPYGMSEDVVVLMIAVVCANLNYCLRFRCDESLTNINSWKE